MHLLLFETSGNQNFIFATNRLRENVGASELTFRAGTKFVLDAVAGQFNRYFQDEDWQRTRSRFMDAQSNPPIEHSGDIEIVLCTSGKAYLLVDSFDKAQAIVTSVTLQALSEAPGLEITGVISDAFDWKTEPMYQVISEVHRKLADVKAYRPATIERFQRIPFVAKCRDSSLPAAKTDGAGKLATPRSTVSICKRSSAENAVARMKGLLTSVPKVAMAQDLEDLDSQLDSDVRRIAVIHADGNGLGEIFLNFHTLISCDKAHTNRQYVDKLRTFSIALEVCTEFAFIAALKTLAHNEQNVQANIVLPLILGGDDVTIIMDARVALPFTVAFLRALERESTIEDEDHFGGVVGDVIGRKYGDKRFTACAGIAFIKPHFPFYQAYELAEELLKSAKQVKQRIKKNGKVVPCSAVDFHVVADSSLSPLESIRDKLLVDSGQTSLFSKPYLTTDEESLFHCDNSDWWRPRLWGNFASLANALTAEDAQGNKYLSGSQLNHLREAMFAGKDYSMRTWRLLRSQVSRLSFNDSAEGAQHAVPLAHIEAQLFYEIQEKSFTSILDAIEVMDLVPSVNTGGSR